MCLHSSHNLNHFNHRISSHYSNNVLLLGIVCLANHHSCSIRKNLLQVIHYRHKYCTGNSLGSISFELNSTKLLIHILKFLLNLWMIVVYFTSLLAKPSHSSHIFHIILSASKYLCWLNLSIQLLLQLLFNRHSIARLLQPFITWTTLILNLWLQYLSQNLKDLLWYEKISHCSLALFKCSDYIRQAVKRLGLSNRSSLWCSTSE